MARRGIKPGLQGAGRVVLYVRVSALMGRGGDTFHSPDVQIAAMRRATTNAGLREVAVIDDDIDRSGRTFERPGIERIRELVTAGKVDVVAVHELSRVGRNLSESLEFIKWLRKHGVSVLSSQEKIDDTPEGQFQLGLWLNLAELYGNQIGRRWAQIIERRARLKRPHGRTKHGYLKGDDGSYIIDPHLGPLVTRMFQQYANGESITFIAEQYAIARGKPIAKQQVKAMLRNPVYLGRLQLRSSVSGLVDVPDAHPPLVDQDTWERVQRRIDADRTTPPRHLEPAYSLTGFGICPYCERHLQVVHYRSPRTREVTRRLHCPHQRATRSCDGIGTPLYAPIEQAVIAEVRTYAAKLRGNPGAVAAREAKVAQAGLDARTLEQELRKTRDAMGRLTERWARGAVPDAAYEQALASLQTAEQSQTAALSAAREVSAAPPASEVVVLIERVLQLWDDMTEAERNRGLRTVLRSFTVRRRARWLEPEEDRVGGFIFRW